jgi:hypothetical protein
MPQLQLLHSQSASLCTGLKADRWQAFSTEVALQIASQFLFFGSLLLLRSVCALQKNTGCAPTHHGSGNGHAAAA